MSEPSSAKQGATGDDAGLAVLKAAYDDIRRENVRLRDARASVTRQLGPLPISAAVIAGLVSGFTPPREQPFDTKLLIGAALVFAAMVIVSITYSNLKPYRVLRAEKEKQLGNEAPSRIADPLISGSQADVGDEAEWYRRMLRLERNIYEGSTPPPGSGPLPRGIGSLKEGFESERHALMLVQSLFAVLVTLLILARLAAA